MEEIINSQKGSNLRYSLGYLYLLGGIDYFVGLTLSSFLMNF